MTYCTAGEPIYNNGVATFQNGASAKGGVDTITIAPPYTVKSYGSIHACGIGGFMDIRIAEITRTKQDAERLTEYSGLILTLPKKRRSFSGDRRPESAGRRSKKTDRTTQTERAGGITMGVLRATITLISDNNGPLNPVQHDDNWEKAIAFSDDIATGHHHDGVDSRALSDATPSVKARSSFATNARVSPVPTPRKR